MTSASDSLKKAIRVFRIALAKDKRAIMKTEAGGKIDYGSKKGPRKKSTTQRSESAPLFTNGGGGIGTPIG
jgi:hypothetical protein